MIDDKSRSGLRIPFATVSYTHLDVYKRQVWGLDDAPYMTKNLEYRCLNIGGANGTVLGTSSDSETGGEVLGLASTGNDEFLYNLWLLGLVTMICGVWLKKISLASQK